MTKEEQKKYKSDWYNAHKEQVRKSSLAYYYNNLEQEKEHHRDYYYANRERIAEYHKKYLKRDRASHKALAQERQVFINNYKHEHGCVICGETDPVVLDLHHLGNEKKFHDMGFLIHKPYSMKVIMKELAKCVVICKNDHARVTQGVITIPSKL